LLASAILFPFKALLEFRERAQARAVRFYDLGKP